jgi:hypothetical protein
MPKGGTGNVLNPGKKRGISKSSEEEGRRFVIIYDLKCEKNHKFEGWFNDRSAYETQKAGHLITCPICGSSKVEMVPSTISILGKETETGKSKEISPLKAVQLFQDFLNKNFDDVGEKFAEVAMKIQSGEEEKRNIKGTTTKEEEEQLKEAGVQFYKVSVPKLDS